jgi:hypothetical protein
MFPVIAWAGPLELRDGGRELLQANKLGANVTWWSLRLRMAVKSAHVAHEELIVVREVNRMRIIIGGAPGSTQAAQLRTLPLQLRQPLFKEVSQDRAHLVFESGMSREEVDIGALSQGDLRSIVRTPGQPPRFINERLATPVSPVFWKPLQEAGYLGPGHGSRKDVAAAFSTPRPNELLEEFEPYDCALPLHYNGGNWEATQAHVFEHTLRDRKGNTQVFFTATESGEVKYLTAAEAAAQGCEASNRRHRMNMTRSFDPSQKLGSEEFVVRVELLDQELPADGVIVRLREKDSGSRQSCSDPNLGPSRPDLSASDGLTLADGTFAWKLWHRRHRTSGRMKFDITQGAAATLCVRVDGSWIPIWHSPSENRGYLLRCDLAAPKAARCRRFE